MYKLKIYCKILCFFSLLVSSYSLKEPPFAPYVDITRIDGDYLVNIHRQTGLKAVTLAFVLGGTGGCKPTWGGQFEIDDAKILNSTKSFQKQGGKVILATGGAMGPYLETSCSSPSLLAAAYKKALETVETNHLDIDIESSVPLDTMNSALKILETEIPDLTVSFTLMIQGDDYGLTDILGVEVLKNAVKHDVKVDIVNAMCMEFWTKLPSWGDAVIQAAESVFKQMKQIWSTKSDQELYAMLGVTPMLGRNYNGKIFEIQHAKELVNWAKSKKVGHLSFWSLGRDNGKCPSGGVSPDCSSISQQEFEFTKVFQQYADTEIPDFSTKKPDENLTTTKKPNEPITTTKKPNEPITTTKKSDDHTHTEKPEKMDCSKDNKFYKHETYCDKYYWCYDGVAHLEQCPPGTVWDVRLNLCNFPKDANRHDCK